MARQGARRSPSRRSRSLGGIRTITHRGAESRTSPPSRTCSRPPARAAADVRARRGGGDPLGLRRGAEGDRRRARRRRGARRRGPRTRRTPRSSGTRIRTGTSRCSSPSSRWSRRPPGPARGGSRSRRRSRPSSPGRTTSSAWRRSAAPTSAPAARTRESRSARTALADGARGPRRVPAVHGRPSSTPATRTRRPSSSRRWPISRASSSSALPGETPVIYERGRGLPDGGAKVVRSSDDDEVTLIGAGITLLEALKAADALAEEGVTARVIDLYSVKPIDVETLRARRPRRRRPLRRRRGPLARGRPRRGGAGSLRRRGREPAKASTRPRGCRPCGKPEELLAEAGSTRTTSARAARGEASAQPSRGPLLSSTSDTLPTGWGSGPLATRDERTDRSWHVTSRAGSAAAPPAVYA